MRFHLPRPLHLLSQETDMGTIWKTRLPGENPALAESLERVMARVAPNPATAHWGMRGGFVKLKADATLALQLAGNDLTLNGYAEDLERDGIQALLVRLVDALAGAFTLPAEDLGKLHALATGEEPEPKPDLHEAETPTGSVDPTPPATQEMASPRGEVAKDSLAELVLELVSLNRGLHSRLVRLEARVDALEGLEEVEDTLARAERLAQALKRS